MRVSPQNGGAGTRTLLPPSRRSGLIPSALRTTGRRSRASGRRRQAGVAIAYLLPLLLVMATFVYYPIVRGVAFAFQHVHLLRPSEWVGLENFRVAFNDPAFGQAWLNTVHYAGLVLVASQVLPLIYSLAVHEVRFGKAYFQLAAYLPVIMPPIVTALLWGWMFDPNRGFFNALLSTVGVGEQAWLNSPDQALYAVAMITIWGGWGFAALVYLAALGGIPGELYEAAEIDGARLWKRVRYITFPQVRSHILLLLLLGMISVSQMFALPFVMTGGGPVNSTITVTLLVYRYAFELGDLGVASAIAVLLLAALAIFSALYMWLTRRLTRI